MHKKKATTGMSNSSSSGGVDGRDQRGLVEVSYIRHLIPNRIRSSLIPSRPPLLFLNCVRQCAPPLSALFYVSNK